MTCSKYKGGSCCSHERERGAESGEVVTKLLNYYGVKEQIFLADVHDADAEHSTVERWHRSIWMCSAAEVQRSALGHEDKNSSLWFTA